MTVSEYMSSLRGRQLAVVGAGVSNLPLIELLLAAGNNVTVCDRRSPGELGALVPSLEAQGVRWRLGEDYLRGLEAELIFRTPGLHPNALAEAAARGAELTSEMELFFRFCPCRTIAVTGSDGKTTTSTVIAELLRAQGHTVHLGGNIGHPLLAETDAMDPGDLAVLELSSFQLHSMYCAPDVAVITNLAPNHLDVHPDMADYVRAKTMIFRNQRPEARLILNADDGYTPELAAQAHARVALFSRRHAVADGAYAQDGTVYLARAGQASPLLQTSDIRLPGLHNLENYLAAFAAVDGLAEAGSCIRVAREFGGVAHRIEPICQRRGVRYYNDSIASSPSRTIAGLRSFSEKPILIAGGYDKHIPFDELGREIVQRVKALCLNGFTAEKIRDAVTAAPGYDPAALPIYMDGDFDSSVRRAAELAAPGDVVLMSPACAAFDQFKNFVERGEHFRRLILDMEE